MSLILEALKKLDREKAFIKRVTANIADEILKSDPVRPRKKLPLYFAAVLITVCLTATLTYFVVARQSLPTKKAPPLGTASPETSQAAGSPRPSPAPVREAQEGAFLPSLKDQDISGRKTPSETEFPPPSGPKIMKTPGHRIASGLPAREPERGIQDKVSLPSPKSRLVAESRPPLATESSPPSKPDFSGRPGPRVEIPPSPREPAREGREENPPYPLKEQALAENKMAPPVPGKKKEGQDIQTAGADTRPAIPKTVSEPYVGKPAASPPALKLTGIVWSENPSARYAVINGAIVAEGAVILGAKIVEILPSKVRMIQNERPFEIQLF